MIARWMPGGRACWVALGSLLLGAGCAGPAGKDVFVLTPPPEETFTPVARVFEMNCGTLDCHGTPSRNMRIFGFYAARLDPKDRVGATNDTTDAERNATYESVIAIQPEVLSKIFAEHGAHPERWIVITKGRGSEVHKGGGRLPRGSAGDACITSWLAAAVNQDACTQASTITAPGGPEW